MKRLGVLFAVLVFFGLTPLSFSGDKPSVEKSAQPADREAVHSGQSKGADIMLLIDSSGSMRKTDPHDYRKTAAELFISLLSSDDRAGVVSFGDSAKLLLPLTRCSKESYGRFTSAINKISSREFSTNIYDGVKMGFDELKTSQSSKKVLLLLSDGKLTLGSKEKEAEALSSLSALLPKLVKSGITLSTIAFSDQADAKFLDDLARAGGGFFKLALTDQDIHIIFASMFEKIKSPDEVPFDGNSFSIDKDIKEAIVFISKKAGTMTTLVDPSGKKNTPAKFGQNIQWYQTNIFDLITVSDPVPGKWQVNLSTKQGNKVFVITNLSLKTSFNTNFVNKNEKVRGDVWLEKDGGILKERDILDQVVFSAVLAGPDGKSSKIELHAGGQPQGGVFSFEFVVPQTGDYALTLMAQGKTFKRTKTIQFKAVEHAPAPPAAEKNPQVPALNKKASVPVNTWGPVLIKFGIINAVLLAAAGALFVIKKIKDGRNNRKTNKKGRASKK
ncbi:MAG: VWA domain-containing protein [Dissulfurispiraceae bacterium]